MKKKKKKKKEKKEKRKKGLKYDSELELQGRNNLWASRQELHSLPTLPINRQAVPPFTARKSF